MSEWCDEHNVEKEREETFDGEVVYHCPYCEYDRHEAYLKKWRDMDVDKKKKSWWPF